MGGVGYGLRVTGIRNVLSAVFEDIRDGAAHRGNVQLYGLNYVVQEGTAPDTTNVVVWTVPANVAGHRVVLRAVPDLGPNTTADDTVLQEYFLDVSAPSKRLPQPTVITRATPTPEGFGLRWVGSADSYQVERATHLLAPSNTVWQSIGETPAAAVNFHVDTNPVPPRAFYRILNTP